MIRVLTGDALEAAQADNCIALYGLVERSKSERVAVGRGHIGSASRSPALTTEMQALYEHAKSLNAVGLP